MKLILFCINQFKYYLHAFEECNILFQSLLQETQWIILYTSKIPSHNKSSYIAESYSVHRIISYMVCHQVRLKPSAHWVDTTRRDKVSPSPLPHVSKESYQLNGPPPPHTEPTRCDTHVHNKNYTQTISYLENKC